jgi:outer membrane protein OmpA-like peptidoglycan-associated protein
MTTINLLDDMQSLIGPKAPVRFGSAVGESPEAMTRASHIGSATLIGGLTAFSQTPEGASRLLDLIRIKGYADPDASTRLGATTDDALRSEGSALLDTIFGTKLTGAVDGAAASAGVGQGSMHGLLSMLAPLAMLAIGRRVREGGLDSEGLAAMLGAQPQYLRGHLPDSVAHHLGLMPTWERRMRRRRLVMRGESERRSGWRTWVAALFAVGLVALVVALMLRGLGERREARVEPRRTVAERVERPRVEMRAVPRALRAEAREREGIDGLAHVMRSRNQRLPASFDIEGLRFSNASSSLTTGGASLDRIAQLMKQHQRACLQIDGHADATGDKDFNERLSRDRANVVRNALIRRGVDSDRVTSVGRGAEHPVASNDTPEGRNRNRRAEVVLESCA